MAMAQKPHTPLRPLHDRVLVKRLAEGDEKHGSIIIPDTAKEKPQEGKIVAVWTGRVTDEGKNQPLDVKQGDRTLFGKTSANGINRDAEEFPTMKEEATPAAPAHSEGKNPCPASSAPPRNPAP